MNTGQTASFDAVLAGRPRCTGPTVDLGCGPGHLIAELAERGVLVGRVAKVRYAVQRGAS